jgi:hypothetical protein
VTELQFSKTAKHYFFQIKPNQTIISKKQHYLDTISFYYSINGRKTFITDKPESGSYIIEDLKKGDNFCLILEPNEESRCEVSLTITDVKFKLFCPHLESIAWKHIKLSGPTGATGPCCTGPTGSTGEIGPLDFLVMQQIHAQPAPLDQPVFLVLPQIPAQQALLDQLEK